MEVTKLSVTSSKELTELLRGWSGDEPKTQVLTFDFRAPTRGSGGVAVNEPIERFQLSFVLLHVLQDQFSV